MVRLEVGMDVSKDWDSDGETVKLPCRREALDASQDLLQPMHKTNP